MRTHCFGSREVSVIGLGSTDFGGKCPESQARDFLDAYLALGGNLIDTAHVYGDFVTPRNGESEKVIGRWMADRHVRDQIFLSTKGAHPPIHNMHESRLSREDIRTDMAESLDALGTDHVDIYWLHRDDEARPVGEIMETLQSLIDDGTALSIGVSNWKPGRILEANAYAQAHHLTPLCAEQPQFSLAIQNHSPDPTLVSMGPEAYRMHLDTGMACFCFSSQAHGYFTKLDQFGAEGMPDRLRARWESPENSRIYARMKELQSQTGLSVHAIALAWLTSQPFPTFALVGASRMEHVESLRDAMDAALTDSQREAIRSLR